MKKIGIIATYRREDINIVNRLAFDYVRSVDDSGAIAYIIPANTQHIDHFISEMDGFIFPGAKEDVTPSLYGKSNDGSQYCEKENDLFLLDAMEKVYQSKKPILGICKGHQIINVYFGGTLIQSIPDEKLHLQLERENEVVHEVSIEKQSFLHDVFGTTTLGVNSMHHQAIDTLGKKLKITAQSSDDYVEAIEYTGDQHIYGIQWHPECLSEHLPIFQKFIEKI